MNPSNTETLSELLARVEKAEAPDLELGRAAANTLLSCGVAGANFCATNGNPAASLDAALALLERVLPGCDWTISNESPIDGPGPFAWVQPAIGEGSRAYGKTPALALLAAMLTALISKEEGSRG